jgi:hypothetical protein
VRWPNGTVQRFGDMAANAFIKIVEGSPEVRIVSRTRRHVP